MALMAPMTPEEQAALMQAPASPAFAMVQHPMHAMIAPLGPPPPEIDPMAAAAGMTPGYEGEQEKNQAMSATSPKQPKVTTMSPLERFEDKQGQRLMSDMHKDADPYGSPDNHPGFFGKLLHGLNVATGGVNRRGMEETGIAKGLNANENEVSKRGLEGAQTESATATAGHTNAETPEVAPDAESKRQQEAAQTGLADVETDQKQQDFAQGPTLARSLDYYVNKALKENRDPQADPYVNHLQDAIQAQKAAAAAKGKEHVNLQDAKGKPMGGSYDPNNGKYYDAAGNEIPNPVPFEKPQVTNNNFENREGDKGRALLDKAEASYRTAQQGANGMKAMIDDALQGGKMSARMLPLEGALEITTANGVHRINRTEVDQYAGGGNAFDRLAGQLSGATTGVPFTKDILQSMKHLTDIQEQGAYNTYKDAYGSATKRYHLGADEQPLAGPSGSGQSFTDGGVTYNIPAEKVAEFKKDHPNAR